MEIDLVIPMVFPEDPEWKQTYARFRSGDASRNVRWRSWGTEELMVRCCLKNMPWLRRIYLLLASPSQVRGWMRPTPAPPEGEPTPAPPEGRGSTTGQTSIHLVFHREFIPEEYLPCFSSPCIEMFLHRIPGLAERFIYANDDMFPLSPLEATDFFRERPTPNPPYREGAVSLLPCQHWEEKSWPVRPSLFQRKCRNQQRMIAAGFGVQLGNTWLRNGHCFAPLLKSICETVWERHGEEIRKHLSPLKRTEHSYNHYIYSLYQHFAGLEVDHVPRQRYVGKETPTARLAKIISDPEAGIVCINDSEKIDDWEKRAKIVRDNLNLNVNDNEDDNLNANDNPNDNANPNDGDNANDNANDNDGDDGVRVLIVHYNTPELTAAAIRSLWKHTPEARVTIFDNSDKQPFCCDEIAAYGEVEVIDNTKGQRVDWERWLLQFPGRKNTTANNWGSAKHCYSVDLCMDRFPDGFILMDSDVLVKRDVSDIVDHSKAFVGEECAATRKFPVPRLMPMLCWLNTPMLKEKGIRYFNAAKMWKLTGHSPECFYDTGAWFLEAVRASGLPYRKIVLNDYILHFGSGSWKQRKNHLKWINENRRLWDVATSEHTRIYICTHTDFSPVVRHPVYEVVDARQWNGDVCENGLRGSFYSELISYKHVAERKDLPTYVGFCAYRKYFAFMNDVPDMGTLFKECDAVTTTPLHFSYDVRTQYARCHNVKDLDIVSDIVKRDYPDFWPSYEHSLRQSSLYACNMFIVRRDDFRWMMKTVFDILDKYLDVVGTDIEVRIQSHPQDYHLCRPKTGVVGYQYRIGGFLGERIVNALLRYRFKRIKHYDKIITAQPLPQNT